MDKNTLYVGYEAIDENKFGYIKNIIYKGEYISLKGDNEQERAKEINDLEKSYPGLTAAIKNMNKKLQEAATTYQKGTELINAGNVVDGIAMQEEAANNLREFYKTTKRMESTDVYFKGQKLENVQIYPKSKKTSSLKKKVVAGVLAAAILTGGAMGLSKLVKGEPQQIEQVEDNKIPDNLDELSLKELMGYLNEGAQYDAFKEMSDAQDYFNNTAAPTIKTAEDKGGQLYLTAEEIITMYKYANAKDKSPEEFFEIFGNSGFSDELVSASKVMTAYYLRANEASGLASMFGEKAEEVEGLYLKWNSDQTRSNRSELRTKIFNYFDRYKIDNLKETDPESATYILQFMVPTLLQNNIISNSEYKDLVNQNKSLTCNEIINTELKEATDYAIQRSASDKELENINVVKEMPRAMDEANIKVKDRNRVVQGAGIEYRTAEQIKALSEGSKSYNEKYAKETTKVSKKTAIEKFGKEKVKEAEKEAKEDFDNTYGVQNEKQAAYDKGHQQAFNKFEPMMKTAIYSGKTISFSDYSGQIASLKASYTGKYASEYAKGVDYGARQAYNIALQEAQKEKDDYEKKHPTTGGSGTSSNGSSKGNSNGNSNSNNGSSKGDSNGSSNDDYVAPPEDEISDEYISQSDLDKQVKELALEEETQLEEITPAKTR